MSKINNELSFEEALQELEVIVKKLETGEVLLDDAIKEFNKAIELSNICDKKLKAAEETIVKLVNSDNKLEDFNIKESSK